ncbi:SCAN domain-containing protein 3-like [Hydra vulgaris]|uniref:SCAN domain-containing protein 3-like n=1 Tax=Hydra vulgaris TaxID=6087 RepID=A0ABM4DK96_HYDVU
MKTQKINLRESSPFGNYGRVVSTKDVFSAINIAHCQNGLHLGALKTHKKIIEGYAKFARKAVEIFISFCPTCNLNKRQLKKALQPIFSTRFLQRLQIDLIAMESKPDNEFRYIGHVVDHFSKFHILFPMRNKTAVETANYLKDLC